jgi:hypothetical protein
MASVEFFLHQEQTCFARLTRKASGQIDIQALAAGRTQ